MFKRKPKTDAVPSDQAPDYTSGTVSLTPEDIVNKRFRPTKFREGYDQDEIDEFLDTVVTDFRTLIAKNEKLERENAQLKSAGQP